MLPGALLTLLIVGSNARALLSRPVVAFAVLIGDAARWVLAAVVVANSFSATPMNIPFGSLDIPEGLLGLAFLWTNAYTLSCWAVALAMRPVAEQAVAPWARRR